ncbi:hypothetical protein P7C73_g6213, partial [Tremellales sp. Uapishka_1]
MTNVTSPLPPDLLERCCHFLQHDQASASLSALLRTSRYCYSLTLPYLYSDLVILTENQLRRLVSPSKISSILPKTDTRHLGSTLRRTAAFSLVRTLSLSLLPSESTSRRIRKTASLIPAGVLFPQLTQIHFNPNANGSLVSGKIHAHKLPESANAQLRSVSKLGRPTHLCLHQNSHPRWLKVVRPLAQHWALSLQVIALHGVRHKPRCILPGVLHDVYFSPDVPGPGSATAVSSSSSSSGGKAYWRRINAWADVLWERVVKSAMDGAARKTRAITRWQIHCPDGEPTELRDIELAVVHYIRRRSSRLYHGQVQDTESGPRLEWLRLLPSRIECSVCGSNSLAHSPGEDGKSEQV